MHSSKFDNKNKIKLLKTKIQLNKKYFKNDIIKIKLVEFYLRREEIHIFFIAKHQFGNDLSYYIHEVLYSIIFYGN